MWRMRVFILLLAIIFAGLPSLSHGATVLSVPFTSQAPFGVWTTPYQDFCEEASIVMAAHFVWNMPIPAEIADLEMRIVERYEKLALGRSNDTSAEDAFFVLKNLYGFKNISIHEIASAKDIKKELSSGKIILVPVAGRMLKNPYFTPPGPVYHMLVIAGFNDEAKIFTTNDPGTRRGKNLLYNQTVLFNAIHDWNNSDVMNGKKMIVSVGR